MLNLDLTGKLAIVTGAAGNLGRVISRTLAQCGADVAVHYSSSRDKAEALCAQIQGMGRRSMIVNNAVAQYKWTTVLEQDVADFESQFRSCVLHNVNMAKAFVPHMVEQKYGRVIAINTECAMQDMPGKGAYVSGKRGQDGALRSLCLEVAPSNVTVNQIAPGWMITEDFRANPTDDSEYVARVPLGRRGDDQEIANAVCYLASDLAGFITGAVLPVAGGLAMSKI